MGTVRNISNKIAIELEWQPKFSWKLICQWIIQNDGKPPKSNHEPIENNSKLNVTVKYSVYKMMTTYSLSMTNLAFFFFSLQSPTFGLEINGVASLCSS